MDRHGIVLLAADGPSTRAVYHRLCKEFGQIPVVLEDRQSRLQVLRRRLRRQPLSAVLGQTAFMAVAYPWLRRQSARRIADICRQFDLDQSPIAGSVVCVPTVNAAETRAALAQLGPAVVVVNGTRILSRQTLSAIGCPVINMHAGITPLYRGVHGGYWALTEGRADLVGTTVHLVDAGIDTGQVVGQVTFPTTRADSFATYPYLHTAAGLPLLVSAVRDALAGRLVPLRRPRQLASRLRYHPTLWGYARSRWLRGVR